MRFIHFLFVFFLSFPLVLPPSAQAYWIWSPAEGKFIKPESTSTAPEKSADELYEYALKLRQSGKDDDEAIQELRRLIRQYPGSAYAPEGQYLLATLLEEKEKPVQAAAEFQKLIRDFPRSERIEEATTRLFNLGQFFLTGEKQKVIGLSLIPVLPKAVEVFRFIVEQAPYGPYGDQAQLKLAIAYRKLGRFDEAVQTLETLISNYPTSTLLDEAHYQLAETSYELSQNAIRDQKSRNQAADHLKEFLKQYGNTSLAERARILKGQLDEQDAEKNYRIGLYYEREGFIESALIYYEDVANRYAHTAFGQKAADRYQSVNEPTLMMAKGKETVDRRFAEVQSMLQALDQEEKRQRDSKVVPVSDTVDLRKQLEAELTTLKLTQKEFKEDSREKFQSRKQALRDREKNLREKFKTFGKRKRSMKHNTAPELQVAFQRWEASLLKEQEELARERGTVSTMGAGLKEKEPVSSRWIPYFGGIGVPSEEKLIHFEEKKWNKLVHKRIEFKQARETYETELAGLVREIAELEQREFEMAESVPEFENFLPDDLKGQKQALNAMHMELSQWVEVFGQAKGNYEGQYGSEFLKTMEAQKGGLDSRSIQELIAGGANLESEFEALQKQKAALSQNWLAGKERLATLMKALNPDFSAPESEPSLETQGAEDRAKEVRMLKKRIKFLEREMRSRIDQILDWERENAKRMDDLNRLLHPEEKAIKMGDTTQKMLSPAAGTYKLFKAFIFGLPNRDRELLREARQKIAQESGKLSPEHAEAHFWRRTSSSSQKVLAQEARGALRELEEEIALQSVLIQGRANEVTEIEKQLEGLREQAKQFPEFEYQSMLIDRFPSALSHSVRAARELFGGENQEAALASRIDRQTRELERLEQEMAEADRKIEPIALALEQTKKPDPVTETAAGILASLPGGTESLPTPAAPEALPVDENRKNELETELFNLNDRLTQAKLQHQEASAAFRNNRLNWYRSGGREKLGPALSSEGKALAERAQELSERETKLRSRLASAAEKEYQIAQSQIRLLDEKLEELEKRSSRLERSEASLVRVLDAEVKRTGALRGSLTREMSLLENLIKQ